MRIVAFMSRFPPRTPRTTTATSRPTTSCNSGTNSTDTPVAQREQAHPWIVVPVNTVARGKTSIARPDGGDHNALTRTNGRVHRANNNPTTTDRNLDHILRRSSVDNGNRLPKRNAVQLSRCEFYFLPSRFSSEMTNSDSATPCPRASRLSR